LAKAQDSYLVFSNLVPALSAQTIMEKDTRIVRAGFHPDPSTGAMMPPIYQTSTYAQESPNVNKGYSYARTSNPTRDALQEAIAELEQAQYGLAFATGMAAEDAIIHLMRPGDEVLVCKDLYGGTYRLFMDVYAHLGIKFHFVDFLDLEGLKGYFNEQTKLVWIETPTNPLLSIFDIRAIADMGRANGALVVVDNTFASPYLQQPLALGAHISMHSATKYLGGHSDTVLGLLALNDQSIYDKLKYIQKSVGAVPGPMDCFLVYRGIKTLHVRMERHCQNAAALADYLKTHPALAQTYYPGLPEHPGHKLAASQMTGFGGMVSFYLKNDTVAAASKVLSSLKVFTLAESLGGVESLANHPASMTHGSIPRETRLENGLHDSCIRLSVGIEDAKDLIADLEQALATLG
jgi:cystathionine beta-lyase/cystathionine gamma-synthase